MESVWRRIHSDILDLIAMKSGVSLVFAGVCLFYGIYRFLICFADASWLPVEKGIKDEFQAVYSKWAGVLLVWESFVMFGVNYLQRHNKMYLVVRNPIQLALLIIAALIPIGGIIMLQKRYKK